MSARHVSGTEPARPAPLTSCLVFPIRSPPHPSAVRGEHLASLPCCWPYAMQPRRPSSSQSQEGRACWDLRASALALASTRRAGSTTGGGHRVPRLQDTKECGRCTQLSGVVRRGAEKKGPEGQPARSCRPGIPAGSLDLGLFVVVVVVVNFILSIMQSPWRVSSLRVGQPELHLRRSLWAL